MNTPASPVAEQQRLQSLDVLRGFALLGILSMNIGAFAMPAAAYFDPTLYGDLAGINMWLWGLTHLLADMKFMAIFSMLFGAGIVLLTERAEARGDSSFGLHYRRMGWLVIFGLLHAHLLWYGDVLLWYGMTGLVVYWLRKRSATTLVLVGLLFLAVASSVLLLGGLTQANWPPQAQAELVAELKPSAETLAAEVAIYQSGWLEQLPHRSSLALNRGMETFLVWAFWRAGGLMLLGMALYKLGVLSAQRSRRFYLALVAVAVLVGLPLVGYGMAYNFAIAWAAPDFFFFGSQYNYWGSILVALGWIGAIMLLCQLSKPWLVKPLAAVGRMALSNYLLHTLICTTLFYGHGLGLFGQLTRSGQWLVVLAIWALQLVLSPLWLRYFCYGPLEWLWRSLVYRQRQPLRRQAAVPAPRKPGNSHDPHDSQTASHG